MAVILDDLGAADRIVGRHAYDLVLDPEIPVVGDQAGIDYEALLRAAPTHVLLESAGAPPPPRLTSLAAEEGWRLVRLPLLTLDDIRAATRRLADLMREHIPAGRAHNLLESLNAAVSPRPGLASRAGRTLALYWTSPVGAAGPGSFHAQLLGSLGVEAAVESGSPYVTLDLEDVRALNPDSILLFMPGATQEATDLLGPLARVRLRAVETGRVAVIAHPLCLIPSTAVRHVAAEIVREIQRWPRLNSVGAVHED